MLISFVTVLLFTLIEKETKFFSSLSNNTLLIIIYIVMIGVFIIYKIRRNSRIGIQADDELSVRSKYKSGYFAYYVSIFIWVFIYILQDKFPDSQSMLAIGILLTLIFGFITKIIAKRDYNE